MPQMVNRLVVGGVVAGAVLIGTAAPALAHVSISAPNAVQGGRAVVTIRVPNESDSASTVGLKIQLPPDQPITSVSVKPHESWTYKVSKTKLATPLKTDDGEITEAVSTVEWTAAKDAGIKSGEFDEFQVNLSPLPKSDSLTLKAIQKYSDGTSVDWIQQSQADGAESDHPAPSLRLAPAGSNGDDQTNSGPAVDAHSSDNSNAASKSSVKLAMILGVAGLVLGLSALPISLLAQRKKSAKASSNTE